MTTFAWSGNSEPGKTRNMADVSPSESYETMTSARQGLTCGATGRFFRERGIVFGAEQMESLGLMDGGSFTNLAFMLSDQFDQGIKMVVFEDESGDSFLDREEASGSVLDQFEKAYVFVDKHNAKRSRITGPRRVDSRDYPEEVIWEVIVNAIAHRDYGTKGDTSILMFRDRITVQSVGGINAGLGIDDITAGISSRRNPGLASVLYRLELIDAYGMGMHRIMGLYRKEPSTPWIEATANSFKIVLPKTSPVPLSDDEIGTLGLFVKHEVVRRSDVEAFLGVSKTKAAGILSALVREGLVVRSGSGRCVHYIRASGL